MSTELSGCEDTEISNWLVQQADLVLRCCDLESAELSLVVCTDAAIRELNARGRGRDEATDVLSFPQDDDALGTTDRPVILGDVVISLERAGVQAKEQGHDLRSELAVLLVHGICHLRGFAHDMSEDRDRMQAEEARLLSLMGFGVGLVERTSAR